jgi:hypothetical protein
MWLGDKGETKDGAAFAALPLQLLQQIDFLDLECRSRVVVHL